MKKNILFYLNFILLTTPLAHSMERPEPETGESDLRSRSITLRLRDDAGAFVNASDLVLDNPTAASGSSPMRTESEGSSSMSPTHAKRVARLQRQPGIKDLSLCLPRNSVPRILFKDTIERLFAVEATTKFMDEQGKQVAHTPRKLVALTRVPYSTSTKEKFQKSFWYQPIKLFPDDPDRQNVLACLKIDPYKKDYIDNELKTNREIHGEFDSLEIRTDSTIQAERSFLVKYILKNDQSYIVDEEVLQQQKRIYGMEQPNHNMLKNAAKKFTVAIYVMDEKAG